MNNYKNNPNNRSPYHIYDISLIAGYYNYAHQFKVGGFVQVVRKPSYKELHAIDSEGLWNPRMDQIIGKTYKIKSVRLNVIINVIIVQLSCGYFVPSFILKKIY